MFSKWRLQAAGECEIHVGTRSQGPAGAAAAHGKAVDGSMGSSGRNSSRWTTAKWPGQSALLVVSLIASISVDFFFFSFLKFRFIGRDDDKFIAAVERVVLSTLFLFLCAIQPVQVKFRRMRFVVLRPRSLKKRRLVYREG